MKTTINLITLCICVLLLTGCWDQRPFKNTKIITTAAYDQAENQNVESTVLIPSVQGGKNETETEQIQLITTEDTTVSSIRSQLDLMISKSLDPAVVDVILIGEDLAKEDIYPILDAYFRNPRSNLNAMVGIVEGTAGDALKTQLSQEPNPSKYFSGLIDAAINSSHFYDQNLQLICAEMFEPGQDYVLPYLKIDSENSIVKVEGLSLFHERGFTGDVLKPDDAMLLMLMDEYRGKSARLTKKITEEYDNEFLNYITVDIMDSKNDINIQLDQQKVVMDIKLTAKIIEYPLDHLNQQKRLDIVTEHLNRVFNEDAEKVINQIQEANSDVFGLGRLSEAYHNKEWNKLDWNEAYPELDIETNVDVEVKFSGSLN